MAIFRRSVKVFTGNLFLLGAFLLGTAGLLGFCIYWQVKLTPAMAEMGSSAYHSVLLVGYALRACPLYFVLLSFLSFEYCSKMKSSHLLECLQAGKDNAGRFFSSQIQVLATFNAAFTMVLILEYALYFAFSSNWDMTVVFHALWNFLTNYFLLGMVAIALGGALALYLKRLAAYLVLVIFVFLSTPMLDSVIYLISSIERVSLYWLHDFFALSPPSTSWDVDGLLGYSLLPYRFALMGFWGLLAALFIQLRFPPRRRPSRYLQAATAVLCVGCLTVYLLPASWSVTSDDMGKRSYQADTMYYENHPEAVAAQREEKAAFQVTDYELQFRILLELYGTATMTVSRDDLAEYPFTLYHCYQVSSVTDEAGAPLPYTQEGDYLMVKPGVGKKVKKITVNYRGWSPSHYANLQAAALPGYCVYFPRAGYQTVYQAGRKFSGNMKEMGSFVLKPLPEETNFQVTVKAPKTFYCNLPQTGRNTFAGRSNGLTLLSGFVKEITVDGVRVVYPSLGIDYNEADNRALIQKAVDSGYIPEKAKTVMISGRKGIYSLDYANYSDVTTIPEVQEQPKVSQGSTPVLSTLECKALEKTLPKEKLQMLSIYTSYLYSDIFQSVLDVEKSGSKEDQARLMVEMYDSEQNFLRFDQKCRASGDEAVLEKTRAYLLDETDLRSAQAFLDSLPNTNPEGKEYPATMSFAARNKTEKAPGNTQQNTPGKGL